MLFLIHKLKRASYIIISTLLVLFFTSNYFFYRLVDKNHKKEFKAYVLSNYAKTEIIEINPSELFTNSNRITWKDENKEILFEDDIYDIVSYKSVGKKVQLIVVNDKQEKELMNKYKAQFNNELNNSSNNKHKIGAKDFFNFKYLTHKKISINLIASGIHYSGQKKHKTINGFSTILTPPPNNN